MDSYMFDTMIFNRIVDGNISMSSLKGNNYFATHIQVDELHKTKDEERRRVLLGKFTEIALTIPTESAVWDVSRWDGAKYSDEAKETLFNSLLEALDNSKPNEHDNNLKDALIGETSIRNGFILVTDDRPLFDIVKRLEANVLQWSEFQMILATF